MILLPLNCLRVWSQSEKRDVIVHPSTGKFINDTISIDYIRRANEKMIAYKFLLKEVEKKDSIIAIQYSIINNTRRIANEADYKQTKLRYTNEQLRKEIDVLHKQRWYLAGVSVGAVAALVVSIIIK